MKYSDRRYGPTRKKDSPFSSNKSVFIIAIMAFCLGLLVEYLLTIFSPLSSFSFDSFGLSSISSIEKQHAVDVGPPLTVSQRTISRGALQYPSLLYMTASYSTKQLSSLERVFDSLLDLCNFGYNITIHLQVSNGISYDSPLYSVLKSRLYCRTVRSFIPVIVDSYEKIGFGLNSRHRLFVRDHVEEYDYFVYGEEDMILTPSIFAAYLEEMSLIKRTFPFNWTRYSIGLLRYEELEESEERVTWEYRRDMIYGVQIHSLLPPYFVTINPNQAIYIIPQEQMRDLETRCGFLTDIGSNAFYRALRKAMNKEWKYLAVGVSEWSSTFQLILQCGIRRIIPQTHFENFMIHHATNIAHHRKPKSDLINMAEWLSLVPSLSTYNSLDFIYHHMVYQQFNLHYINQSLFEGKSKWSYF